MDKQASDTFLVPDFYCEFHCKCGECRSCCCVGWEVSTTQDEYFRLLGVDCSSDLRRRLDEAFFIPHDASNERFALLKHKYTGDCPVRSPEGLCTLHCELGEPFLPAVCKLYPRSVRTDLGEATLSNSCEGVVETLYRRKESIRFIESELPYKRTGVETTERMEKRMAVIRILQDRSKPLKERLFNIGKYLCGAAKTTVEFSERITPIRDLMDLYREISISIADYCEKAERFFEGITEEKYRKAEEELFSRFPTLDNLIENLYVNHFFYMKYPFSEERETVAEEFVSLCGLYAFMQAVAVGNSPYITDEDALCDICADYFRLTEHSRFDRNAEIILATDGFGTPDTASALLDL